MRRPLPHRRPRTPVTALVALALLMALAGCGGQDPLEGTASPATSASSPSPSPSPSTGTLTSPSPSPSPTPTPSSPPADPTARPAPSAAATIPAAPDPVASVAGTRELRRPPDGPRQIQGFPIPPGVTVKDPGAVDSTWQFDIRTADTTRILAFYRRVLPELGYRVRTDVSYRLGLEEIFWDVVFDGPTSGTIGRDEANGFVFVVVNPPGQALR